MLIAEYFLIKRKPRAAMFFSFFTRNAEYFRATLCEQKHMYVAMAKEKFRAVTKYIYIWKSKRKINNRQSAESFWRIV